MIAVPAEQSSRDHASVKRTMTLGWAPGDGPRMNVIRYGGRRGTQVFEGALVKAELVYAWSPSIEGWTRQASLFIVAPQGKGWSRNPVRANDSSDFEEIATALHQQYAPRTTVTLTEQDPTP